MYILNKNIPNYINDASIVVYKFGNQSSVERLTSGDVETA